MCNLLPSNFIFFQPQIIDTLVKVILPSKKKPSSYILKASSVLQLINHEEFSSLVLPSLQKAILRSPEIILESVGLILGGLSLDLSRYAKDIGKLLIGKFKALIKIFKLGVFKIYQIKSNYCFS